MEENADMIAARLHYLVGAVFLRKPYRKPREDWDHDHCQVCWKTLAEFEGENVIHEGYASLATEKWPADYHWVCPECFEQYGNRMNWNCTTQER